MTTKANEQPRHSTQSFPFILNITIYMTHVYDGRMTDNQTKQNFILILNFLSIAYVFRFKSINLFLSKSVFKYFHSARNII